MKLTSNKGFTLIELIMVIVILGILAAVVMPKFFDFTTKAHEKHKESVYGAVKAGLNLYAANKVITTGSRTFPDGDDLDTDWSAILDEQPDGWTVDGTGTDSSTLKYTADGSTIGYKSASPYTSYTLGKSW